MCRSNILREWFMSSLVGSGTLGGVGLIFTTSTSYLFSGGKPLRPDDIEFIEFTTKTGGIAGWFLGGAAVNPPLAIGSGILGCGTYYIYQKNGQQLPWK